MIKRLDLNSRESQRDLLNLGRAAASGNWTQAQASVFQLARGSSALSLALSGVGVSLGAVTAGVGALGYMYYQSYRENQEFNRSLALTGNAAGGQPLNDWWLCLVALANQSVLSPIQLKPYKRSRVLEKLQPTQSRM